MEQFSTEEQQAEALRKWLKENGMSIFIGIALGLALMFGLNRWQAYQAGTAEAASLQYMSLEMSAVQGEPGQVVAQAARLRDEYPSSSYAAFGSLTAARLALRQETPDYQTAATELRWVIDNAPVSGLAELARLRLARALLSSGDPDGARAALDGGGAPEFAGLYAEVRGDIAMAQGDAAQARASYSEAVSAHGGDASALLQLKLDNLGGKAG